MDVITAYKEYIACKREHVTEAHLCAEKRQAWTQAIDNQRIETQKQADRMLELLQAVL